MHQRLICFFNLTSMSLVFWYLKLLKIIFESIMSYMMPQRIEGIFAIIYSSCCAMDEAEESKRFYFYFFLFLKTNISHFEEHRFLV